MLERLWCYGARSALWRSGLGSKLVGRMLLLAQGVCGDAQGRVDASGMSVVCWSRVVSELAILVWRCGAVCLALVHVGRAYLIVLLGGVGIVVPGGGGGIIRHQSSMLELTVPRLGIVLVNRIYTLVRRIVHALSLQGELFTRHVSRCHGWRSTLLGRPTGWHGRCLDPANGVIMRQRKGH